METKICKFCKAEFAKNKHASLNYWIENAKYCSNSCSRFDISPETRKKLSLAKKGKKVWQNHPHPRGMLGKTAWNKGNKSLEKVTCQKCLIVFEAPQSQERQFCSRKCTIRVRKGAEATNWKGDNVGYAGLHARVKIHRGRPSKCEHCGTTTAKKFEWANKSGEYKTDLLDWLRLCTKCHIAFDKKRTLGT